MIEIKNLHFSYPGSKHVVYDDFSINFEENRIYGLLGKNGQGKSTLLYLISGLLRAKNGTVFVNGMDATKRQPELLEQIYIVPEEYDIPNVSLKSWIRIHRDFYPRFSEEVLRKSFAEFELPEDIKLNELSMGQKKKVYMCFALAANTQLLLMDEPTNGLDIPSKSLFRKVIAGNMSEDTTLIMSTHQVHDIESMLDNIVIVDNSKILVNASVGEITEKYSFSYRQPGDGEGVLYAEPSLQGNVSISLKRPDEDETPLNLELLFNAATKGKLNV